MKKANNDHNKMIIILLLLIIIIIIIIIAEIKINQMKSLINKFYYLAITISTR